MSQTTFTYTDDDSGLEFTFEIDFSFNRGCSSQYTSYGWTPPEQPHIEDITAKCTGVRALVWLGEPQPLYYSLQPSKENGWKKVDDWFNKFLEDPDSSVATLVEDACGAFMEGTSEPPDFIYED